VSAAAAEHGPVAAGVSHYTSFPRPMTASRTDATATAIHQGRTRHLRQAGLTAAGRRPTATGPARLLNVGLPP